MRFANMIAIWGGESMLLDVPRYVVVTACERLVLCSVMFDVEKGY